jgi:hypothetical protein
MPVLDPVLRKDREMAVYQIRLCRTAYAFATLEIEAESADEAVDKALDFSGDYTYSEKDAEYSVEAVTETERIER